MPTNTETDNLHLIATFGEAWRSKDLEGVMALVTDDCVYAASVGPDPGRVYSGREAVRQGFAELFAYDAAAEPRGGLSFVSGDLGFAEWSYVYELPSGEEREVRGCDLFRFRDGLICLKDAFRKCEA